MKCGLEMEEKRAEQFEHIFRCSENTLYLYYRDRLRARQKRIAVITA